jgi:subtilisin family serine protease
VRRVILSIVLSAAALAGQQIAYQQPKQSVGGPPIPPLNPIQPGQPAAKNKVIVIAPLDQLGKNYVPNEVLVKFLDGNETAGLANVQTNLDVKGVQQIGGPLHIYRVISNSMDMPELYQYLMQNPAVEMLSPNYRYRPQTTTPNDPGFSQQWYMNTIGATSAWDLSTGTKAVTIGVIDSGVDLAHPDLAGNLWDSGPSSFPPAFQLNFNHNNFSVPCGPHTHGFDSYYWDNNGPSAAACTAQDTDGHGTMSFGIIGAVGNNSVALPASTGLRR